MFQAPFSFNGRIRRSEFGFSFIIYVVCSVFLDVIIKSENMPILNLVFIPVLWFIFSQGAKRCHDIGRSGYWQLNPFYTLWLLFQKGNADINEYGSNPKGFDDILPSVEQNNEIQEITSNDHMTYHNGHIDLTKK